MPVKIRKELSDLHNTGITKSQLTDAAFLKLTGASKYTDELDHLVYSDEKEKQDDIKPEEQRIRAEEYKSVLIQDHLK